jgi:hypothetical protein
VQINKQKYRWSFNPSGLLLSASGCAPIISGAMNMNVTNEVVIEKTAKYFGTSREGIVVS